MSIIERSRRSLFRTITWTTILDLGALQLPARYNPSGPAARFAFGSHRVRESDTPVDRCLRERREGRISRHGVQLAGVRSIQRIAVRVSGARLCAHGSSRVRPGRCEFPMERVGTLDTLRTPVRQPTWPKSCPAWSCLLPRQLTVGLRLVDAIDSRSPDRPMRRAPLREQAGAGLLMLTHMWEEHDIDRAARQASQSFGKPVLVARPGLAVTI